MKNTSAAKRIFHLFVNFILILFVCAVGPTPAAADDLKSAVKAEAKSDLKTAAFAAGCFWGTEEFFRKIPGVKETRVGYEGGARAATYKEVTTGTTGHAETLELKYDPKVVSYEKLLDLFFKMHDPTTLNQQGNDRGSQYRSAIFTHDAEQARIAAVFKKKVEVSGAWKNPIVTEIQPAKPFFAAEEYHQKYLIKNPGGYDNHYMRKISFDVVPKAP